MNSFSAKGKKACYNCQNYCIYRFPDEDHWECISGNVSYHILDKFHYNQLLLPRVCGYYNPKLVKECYYCKKTINKPRYNWPYWVVDVFENLPVCSRECQKNLSEKILKEIPEPKDGQQSLFDDNDKDSPF